MEVRAYAAPSVKDAHNWLSQQLQAADFAPTLALAFASVQQNLDALRQGFLAAGLDLFGASSAGELLDTGSGDSVHEGSIALMLLNLPRDAYRLRLFPSDGTEAAARGEAVGAWVRDCFAEPATLLVTAGITTDGEQVVQGVLRPLPEDALLLGGMAGDDLHFKETFVFNQHQLSNEGIIALVFDQAQVQVAGISTSGWQAVGAERTVTKAQGNIVHSIDHQPVTAVYRDYLGLTENAPGSTQVAEYPLRILRPEGYSVMRAALLVDQEAQTMLYAGTVPEGAKVRFCASPGMDIIDHAHKELIAFRHQQPDAKNADALVLFSCKGRHLGLGPMAEDEVHPIQELWEAPLIGFYAYGEIGRTLDGKTDFHNETCVLVTLAEKNSRDAHGT